MKRSYSVAEVADQIAAHLSALGRPAATRFKPGLSDAELENGERRIGLQLHEDLRDLFRWRNGTETEGAVLNDLYFFPWMYFCSLERASAKYKVLADGPGWKRSWMPCFLSGGAEWLGIDCRTGRVVHWSSGLRTTEQYLSVHSMFATILECYQVGCFFVERGGLERQDEQFRQIGLRHNPGLDYWKRLPSSN